MNPEISRRGPCRSLKLRQERPDGLAAPPGLPDRAAYVAHQSTHSGVVHPALPATMGTNAYGTDGPRRQQVCPWTQDP